MRNLQSLRIEPHPSTNFIFGPNGSGKTSLLEAIHVLSAGRSFRSNITRKIVLQGCRELVVFGEIEADEGRLFRAGIRKDVDGETLIRIDGVRHERMSDLALLLPTLALDASAFDLIDGGPAERRQILDWGLFHVEHQFHEAWKAYQVAVRQKTMLLRTGNSAQTIKMLPYWNSQQAQWGEHVHAARLRYLSQLQQSLAATLQEYVGEAAISVEYRPGWNVQQYGSLLEALEAHVGVELEKQSCVYGPHRADLVIGWNGASARDICSRGQKKLVLYAVRLAQVMTLHRLRNVAPVLLLDDIPAELDQENLERIARFLSDYPCQTFITAINAGSVVGGFLDHFQEHSMFHVEHGQLITTPAA